MPLPSIDVDPERLFSDHFALPPLSSVAAAVMKRIDESDAGPREIATLLSADPALVALVFKVVNSAYYALPRRIGSVTQAVAYLGLAEIHRLILTLSVIKALQPADQTEFKKHWRHSYYSALVSRVISLAFYRNLDWEGLHAAVLLHDIGKLVYLKFFPDHYQALCRDSRQRGEFFSQAERRLSCPSHQLLGALLCRRWRLPDSVLEACEFHELEQLAALEPSSPRHDYRVVVCASNLMAHLADGDLNPEVKEQVSCQLRKSLDCSEDMFLITMGEVYALQESVSSFLAQLDP